MTWGDGQYMDYCHKVRKALYRKDLNGNAKKRYLNFRWQYVSKHANVTKEDFLRLFEQMMNDG